MNLKDRPTAGAVFLIGMSQSQFFHPDLEIFLRVTEHLNISKAAESLGVGQSGISKAIARLEDHYKRDLFVRTSKGVELTQMGHQLKSSLNRARSALENSTTDRILYRIAGHRSVLVRYLPRVISALRHHPEIEWSVSFATSHQTVRWVSNLEAEFGFVMSTVRAPDLVCRPLGRQYLALWTTAETPEDATIGYNPEMLDVGRILRRFSRRKLIAVPDYEVLYQCVIEGGIQGILPNTLIRDDRVKMVGTKLKEANVSLIYHRQNKQEDSFQRLAKILAIPFENT
jgi:DNA-binding transcriptional LysR family regulator